MKETATGASTYPSKRLRTALLTRHGAWPPLLTHTHKVYYVVNFFLIELCGYNKINDNHIDHLFLLYLHGFGRMMNLFIIVLHNYCQDCTNTYSVIYMG